uniref:Replication protein E1 n=1 Tax=Human papillomavirus TaxID=10566 RepID=A0A385PNH9_9PAPI|nr:MAG: E1 protein [Human papillomavirus]
MSSDQKGTDGFGGWLIDVEAECLNDSDIDETLDGTISNLLDANSDISDLLDEASQSQGNSLELFHQQESLESEQQLCVLKRKYFQSPSERSNFDEADLCALSPRLENITLTPKRKGKKSRRRLFNVPDSGVELSLQNEVDTDVTESQAQVETEQTLSNIGGGNLVLQILKSKNARATLFAKFKDTVGISFSELTRPYKSDLTCCGDWVIAAFGVREPLLEALKMLLKQYCDYVHLTNYISETVSIVLMLLRFKHQKNRKTVCKLLQNMLNIENVQLLTEPPKLRNVPAAMFWFKCTISKMTYTWGNTPEWIVQQTQVGQSEEKSFDLSEMIQWAYDNGHTDESKIAYYYALAATEHTNARAFLNSNAQAKHVKDCATMVKHYLRAEMAEMSMAAWIHKKLKSVTSEGDWRVIVRFLRYQGVEFIDFLIAFKAFLAGIPKKNCFVFFGPPNTGKSLFCMSLLHVLGGNVISYANSKSHFWLQPLSDTKLVLLDDATAACWDFIDVYLRNALDGNPISLDLKHRAPKQMKCPPLMITTNISVATDVRWQYLHSRIKCITFGQPFPFNEDGSPGFALTNENWKSFFLKFWQQLELSDQEDEADDGKPITTLRVTARETVESL